MKTVQMITVLDGIRKCFLSNAAFKYTPPVNRCLDTREVFNSRTGGGRIELIIGPMFAGKTTELMRRLRRENFARRRCFVIKYDKDVRYSADSMASHDKAFLQVDAAVNSLAVVGNAWQSFDVIGIDEGQFFPDLVSFATTAADAGKTVIISALDGDFRRKPFGQVCDIIPHSESVDKLTAVCMICHTRPGSFTRRIVQEHNEQELIGGEEAYMSTCRECFTVENNPFKSADESK